MSTAMLVESRKQERKALSKLLEKEGLRVESFETPEEAVDHVVQVAPDLVVIDVRMPSKISGFEVLKQLKSYDLPVIFITANESVALKHDLYSVGDVVQGPVASETFQARIRGILKRWQSRAQGLPKGTLSPGFASHVIPELHDPATGRLSASRIAEFLGISLSSLSELSDLSVAGLHKSPASVSLQPALVPIARSLTILTQLLGTRESVRTWMNSPHPDLGGRTPISVILKGKGRIISDMLEASLEGQLS